jgi:hypothetical protein
MPGEQIEYRANLHWLVFVLPILLLIAAIWLFSVGGNIAKFLALILIVGVLVTGLHAVIERMTSEFAVTNKRVLIKTGLIRRHSLHRGKQIGGRLVEAPIWKRYTGIDCLQFAFEVEQIGTVPRQKSRCAVSLW